ncbi:MAG: molybdopterin-guanine dinucleotide biosynthesis protein B [Nitrososphaerota archaeon]|nr:molybdopterin-guanine dinucleotide biosynthesis protein B [Nitrososphaerota archaeon]
MILGVYGYQDSGKTQMIEGLIAELKRKRYRVASIKHTSLKMSIDFEGKDTWRHWKAGSDPVALSTETETSIIKHSRISLGDLAEMISRDFRPDVILVEGGKEGSFPKIAIGDLAPRQGTVMVNPGVKKAVAYIENEVAVERTLRKLPGLDCHKCGADCGGLARAIVAGKRKLGDCKELPNVGVAVSVGGKPLAMGKFASSIVDQTVRGMLGSLKGYEDGKDVEIRLVAKKAATRTRRRA